MITYISDKITGLLIDNGYLKDESYSNFDIGFRVIGSNIAVFLIILSVGLRLDMLMEFLLGYPLIVLMKANTVKFHSKHVDSCLIISVVIFSSQLIICKLISLTPMYIIILGVILLFYSKDKLYIAMIVLSSALSVIFYSYSINLCNIVGSTYLLMMILQTDYCDLILRYYDRIFIRHLDKYFGS